MEALRLAGHTVLFLEPRNSEPLVAALAARGSAIYRDFQRVFPDLHYRTYDMPRRAERDVWLSREAALVDAVIVQSDAPAEIFEWLDRVTDAPMTKVLIALDDTAGYLDLFDLVLSPATVGIGERFEPAVLPVVLEASKPRGQSIAAVYSECDPTTLATLPEIGGAELLATGSGAPENLPFVSEAALSERYRRAAKVIVVDTDPSPFAAARGMLPVAAGAETLLMSPNRTFVPTAAFVDAREQAATFVRLIRDARARRRAEQFPGPSSEG